MHFDWLQVCDLLIHSTLLKDGEDMTAKHIVLSTQE